MVQDYYSLLKRIRDIRRNYPNLSIDEKLNLLTLELKIEAKYIKGNDCHTKSEKKQLKDKVNNIRRHNANKNKQSSNN